MARDLRLNVLQVVVATVLASVLSFVAVSAVLAAWAGETNGLDSSCCGWIGNDNQDGVTGSYSVDNIHQQARISEWDEPSHDWVRDRLNRWGQEAENKLDRESDTRGLGMEMRIHHQDYYNFTGNWQTNLPWSGAAASENFIEEAEQGYTEVDTEIQHPAQIVVDVNYFIDYQVNSQTIGTTTRPDFWTEIEYCDNNFSTNCNYDITGWFRKKFVVQ